MIVALDGGLDHLVPGVHPQMVVQGESWPKPLTRFLSQRHNGGRP